jgi:hypothetical protein
MEHGTVAVGEIGWAAAVAVAEIARMNVRSSSTREKEDDYF